MNLNDYIQRRAKTDSMRLADEAFIFMQCGYSPSELCIFDRAGEKPHIVPKSALKGRILRGGTEK